MMDVYWLEQSEADLPVEDDWLSAKEMLRMDGMRFAKRHADWRLGRWTAKCAVAACLNLPVIPPGLADIEIGSGLSGAPEVFIASQPAEIAISLSHRAGVAVCAVAVSRVELGCDLELVELRSDAFVADYFSADEQALIEQASAERSLRVTLLWSAKESALKALRTGLRLDTRSVIVHAMDPSWAHDKPAEDTAPPFRRSRRPQGWQSLQVVCDGRQLFHGWWQNTGNLVRTMVASPAPAAPILLPTPRPFFPVLKCGDTETTEENR